MKRKTLTLITLLLLFSLTNAQTNNNEWQTKFEKSNYLSTSNYENSIKYFQKIADNSEFAELKTIGISPQGRELKLLIVSKDKIFTPQQAAKSGKAIIFINNGIHSGEIEGKDASMLLLREILITKEQENLLDNVILLIVPVFNLDGHERSSKYGRINQNGPTEMGWRTSAQNFNLNRDFAKADSPEMQALLKVYSNWLPHIFIDNHTTDGADYQYTVTYAISELEDVLPPIRNLVREKILPKLISDVEADNFLMAPYVGYIKRNYNNGLINWVSSPRLSNGYANVQNRIGLLVETHMLKPYKERVFATKSVLESIIDYANNNNQELNKTIAESDKELLKKYVDENEYYPLSFKAGNKHIEYVYKGFKADSVYSKIAGSKIVKYSNIKTENKVPYYYNVKANDSVSVPKAYIIPSEWSNLVEVLKLHGIKVEKIGKHKEFLVEKTKFKDVKFSSRPYEGHFSPRFKYDIHKENVLVNPNDFIVKTNQRSLGMIVHLLEAKAPDSFLKWGMMNRIFERKEYFEAYSMEPIAKKMYDESPELRKKFEEKLKSDKKFAESPYARLNFFYKRSPYYDQKYNVYPILRVVE